MPNQGGMTVKFVGFREFAATLDRMSKAAARAAQAATRAQTDAVFKLSQHYCPVDTYRLKDSGRVEEHHVGDSYEASIEYGGLTIRGKFVDYAIYVHEDPTKYHHAPTRYKFVEVAYAEANAGAYDRYSKYINSELEQEWHL